MADEQTMPAYMKGKTEADSKAGDILYDLKQIKNTRTSFSENNQYRVDNLSYPIDLLSSNSNEKYNRSGNTEYGNNYVIFYINVVDSSKLLKDQGQWYGNKIVEDWTPAQQTRFAGQGVTKEQAEIGVVGTGAVTGAGIGAAVSTGAVKGSLGGAAAGGAAGFISTETVASQTPNFSRQMKRLQAAIALHTPNNYVARYTANYDDASMAGFEMAMRGGENLGRAIADGVKNGNVANEDIEDIKTIGAAIALGQMQGRDSVSTITGLAVNPKREQIFKGVDFRTWQFDYQFFPRSKQEYQNVQNIIYMFKLHMHPEYKDANNFLYVYPSEFDIVHYTGVDENFNLPRHTSCVLTDLSINYSPQSQFTAFEGGIPTQINVQMTFKELIQMSKERIMEGF